MQCRSVLRSEARTRRVLSVVLLLVLAQLTALSVGATGTAKTSDSGVEELLTTSEGHPNELGRPEAIVTRDLGAAASHTALLPLVLKNTGALRPFGVQLNVVSPGAVTKAGDAGAGWVRVRFHWDMVEPVNSTPENFHWPAQYHALLTDLSSRGIQVILTLAGNPSWAASYPSGPIDKVDMGEMVQYLEAAVAHYGQPPYNVKYWEFYNEPDNGNELNAAEEYTGYFGSTPEKYVEILRAVYEPIKAVDPEVQIVFGGIAYDYWTPQGPFVQSFLDRVLEEGGGAYFDIMNFHYYPVFRNVWEPYGNDIIGKVTYLRRKLVTYGLDKPLLCTEAGYWSDAAHGGSDETQSRFVVQVLARSMAADLQTLVWFSMVDGISLAEYKYGLLNPDLSPKPAYFAYNTFSHKMAMADYQQTFLPGAAGASEQIEGYEFVERFGSRHILVAWTNDGYSHDLVLATTKMVITDKFGGETTLLDGDDGVADGRVRVIIGPSPVYLTFEP